MKQLPDYLLSQWDDERDSSTVTAGSGYLAHWKCNAGHKWKAKIVYRWNSGNPTGCPYCSGKRAISGVNDLGTLHPELANEWNDEREINTATAGSGYKAKWRCQKGHSWKAAVDDRTGKNKNGCPYCSGKRVLAGYNDLSTIHPELIEEWCDEREINTVTAGSGYKAKWKCPKGHEHTMPVYKKVDRRSCPICSGKKVLVGYNDLSTYRPDLISEWNDNQDIHNFSKGSTYRAKWKCKNNHEWESTVIDRTRLDNGGNNCPKCSNRISRDEQEIYDYVVSILPTGVEVRHSDRSLIDLELDIYIPGKNIAIEYNGLYWHSEDKGKNKLYHYNKWKKCRDKGIQLIMIWEDDYRRFPMIIHNMIAHKLGLSTESRVAGRKTTVESINKKDAEQFYEQHHIQGHKNGIHYGLRRKDTGDLVALSTWRKDNFSRSVHLERYATSKIVNGGFTKLLNHVSSVFSKLNELSYGRNYDKIVTFADHAVSDGGLYEKNGFIADKVLAPDYQYVVGRERIHKFNYRLKRFKNDPNLKHVEGYTEKQLALLNGIPRIWDCGKTRYVYQLSHKFSDIK